MLVRKHDVRIEEREHLMGGKNSVFSSWLLEIPQFNNAGRVFHKIVIPPQSEIGYHVHKGDSEGYYMLEGSGIYNDNGTQVEVSKGDMMYTPEGCGHGFFNNTDTNAVILACVLYNFTQLPNHQDLRSIKKAGTLPIAELHAPFSDGRGDFYGVKLYDGEEQFTGGGRLFNIVHLLPDCKLGYHEHKNETEVFYMLSGKAIFCDDGVEYEVLPGDVMITGNGHSHSMENLSDEEAVYAALIYFDK